MKKSPLRKVSKKRAKEIREYSILRKAFLEDAPFCEVPDCFNRSSEIHHMNHREGQRLLDSRYFLAVCSFHHRKIHDNPVWAKRNKLFV